MEVIKCHPNILERCKVCLVVSLDGNGHADDCRNKGIVSKIRSSVDIALPMTVFQLRFENVEDKLFYLEKIGTTTGTFIEMDEINRLHAHDVSGVFDIKNIVSRNIALNLSIVSRKIALILTHFNFLGWQNTYAFPFNGTSSVFDSIRIFLGRSLAIALAISCDT